MTRLEIEETRNEFGEDVTDLRAELGADLTQVKIQISKRMAKLQRKIKKLLKNVNSFSRKGYHISNCIISINKP